MPLTWVHIEVFYLGPMVNDDTLSNDSNENDEASVGPFLMETYLLLYIFLSTNVSRILHHYVDVNVESRIKIDADVPTATDVSAHATVDGDVDVDARYLSDVSEIWDTLWFQAYSDPNTECITILRG
ncbi:hypothetical protein J1N35_036889 [Gossypium stocksii]|uniref:Uncharacterized protein n=1 Tax=Gossypium stocksii TaxID=47602 RepID=A0A9D3UIW6_9ROSI|nr:hypothetical protein J1N35_036889 [Gossypium stocksii]